MRLPPNPEIKPEAEPEPEPQYGRRATIMWDKIISATNNSNMNRFEGGDHMLKRNDAFGAALGPDALSLFCWIHHDAIVAKLEGMLPNNLKGALSQTERARKRQDTLAELLAAERYECSLVEAAIDQGFTIAHRRDTDPRAVLALE